MEWNKIRIGDAFSIKKGKKVISEEVLKKGMIRYIQIGDLRNNDNLQYCFYKDQYIIAKKNDIIIAWDGANAGICNYGLEGAIGSTLALLSPKQNNLYIPYIGKFIQSKFLYLRKNCTGATIPHLSRTILENLEIPLSSIEIQIKIANALDKAQELIDNRKLQLEKYDELIQSIFIDMFGDPVTNPKKWEIKRLKEISTKILSGNTPKGGSNVYTKKGIPFFRSQNVWRNKIKYEDIVYIDEAIHRSMQKSSLKNRDILITKTGRINTENSSLGRAAMFLGEDNKGNINGHVYLVRLKKCIVDRFVLYIITTDKYREYIRSICVGAIDKRQINKNHLEEFPIINPPLELQSKFASIVEKIESEKKLCEESLKQMEENFNAMMHKAFREELF